MVDGAIIEAALLKASNKVTLNELSRLSSDIPILIIGSNGDRDDRPAAQAGLQCDFMARPLIWLDVITRLKALLSARPRPSGANGGGLRSVNLRFDASTCRVRFGERQITLSPAEFKMFDFMLGVAGRLIPHQVMFERVWGYEFEPPPQVIEAYLDDLNEKIQDLGVPIALGRALGASGLFRADERPDWIAAR